jgi:hypothetical protein
VVEGEVGFDEGGIEEEGEERGKVRESKEAIPYGGGFGAGQPDLQEGAGGGEEQEGKADGGSKDEEDSADGVGGVDASEVRRDESDESYCEDKKVSAGPLVIDCAARERVGVEVAEEERGLEEDEAGEPDGGGASQDGQELLGGDGFDEEEEQGREEDGGGVEEA